MASSRRLSLSAAIFVNVNIMLGSGLFINSVLLAREVGPLSALIYPLVGLLIFPLIVAFSTLLSYFPGGTFYEFGAHVHPILGFISSWGYFIGKMASAALGIHFSMVTVQQLIPFLQAFNTLFLDGGVLLLFVILNLFNVKTGLPIQYFFVILKAIAISIAMGAALAFFDLVNFASSSSYWAALPSTVPFVVFVFTGFEASCSLSKNIENPTKNAPRAILFSFLIVLTIITLYQLLLYGSLGSGLGSLGADSFLDPFTILLENLCGTHPLVKQMLTGAALAGIATSAFGSSYSILYSNVWNLHTLSRYGLVPFSSYLKQLNRFYAPAGSVIVAGLLMAFYLVISGGAIAPLQLISSSAATLAYSISVLAFLSITFKVMHRLRFMAVLSLFSCSFFIFTAISNAYIFGIFPYVIFSMGLLIGLIMRYGSIYLRKSSNS